MNRVIFGFDGVGGRYYRWGPQGMKFYVRDYGDVRARRMAYNEGRAERLRGGYE